MRNRLRRTEIRVFVRKTAAPVSRAALRQVVAGLRHPAMLESLSSDTHDGRYSIYAWEPVRSIVSGSPAGQGRDPITALGGCLRPGRLMACPEDVPYVGGWIGFLSYEAGRYAEPSAGWRHGDRRVPLSQWRLYDGALIHDRKRQEWIAVAVDGWTETGESGCESAEARLEKIGDVVKRSNETLPAPPALSITSSRPTWNLSHREYIATVRRALDYIAAGDVFQVNIARRLRASYCGDPAALYERLCAANPAAFAAYLSIEMSDGPGAILSSSPELFLRLDGDAVMTRPIKGTAPRVGDAVLDDAARRRLATCPKNAAELNMIIDLVRNDLGRVCRYGTVRVADPGRLETLATVFHRTATVTGRLRPECDAVDLIRAAFPGGSITGAPKVRAMQIIHELEPDGRGPYCGAIGYVGLDGRMQLNLAIRTMTAGAGCVTMHVGSGIVADSDPDEEYAELAAKSAGMMAALGLDGSPPDDTAQISCGSSPALRIAAAPHVGPVTAGVGDE